MVPQLIMICGLCYLGQVVIREPDTFVRDIQGQCKWTDRHA